MLTNVNLIVGKGSVSVFQVCKFVECFTFIISETNKSIDFQLVSIDFQVFR
uniref:Uncharacterized protein n=1 Tax=Siphoviridae sp. ctAUQ2 TaxID=2826182 RepID=A0A8S5MZE5_9CAUD|nr:MAG TPA: hypothetical protein [Siphoviridae sp. ctAUQ2]